MNLPTIPQRDDWRKILANNIADHLMTNGQGQKAYRLQLCGPREEDLGGWSREAVENQIEKVLKGEIP